VLGDKHPSRRKVEANKMMEVGRLCVKIAGRDAGMKCVVVDNIDDNYVMIDGQTRRRKCNVRHLEPLDTVLKIKKGASATEVKAEFKKLKLEVRETKPKSAAPRPTKIRKGEVSKTTQSAETKDKKKKVKTEKPKKEKPKAEKTKETVEKKETTAPEIKENQE